MLMTWINKLANQITNLTGTQGTETGEIIGTIASFVIFFLVAWLFVTGVAFVTGISAAALWSLVTVGCLVYTGLQFMKR